MQWPVPIYVDVPALRPGTVGAYVVAFVAVGAATALRIAIDPYVVGVQYITFFPTVIITTLISGFGAGVLCVVLSAAAAAFFVLPPRLSFYVERPADVVDLLLFILEALFYVILIAGMRLSLERYRDLSRNLEQRVEERNVALRAAHRVAADGTGSHPAVVARARSPDGAKRNPGSPTRPQSRTETKGVAGPGG